MFYNYSYLVFSGPFGMLTTINVDPTLGLTGTAKSFRSEILFRKLL